MVTLLLVGVYYVLYSLNPNILLNYGLTRPFTCVLPEGTVVNPRFPAWVYLSAGAGANLPLSASYRSAGGSCMLIVTTPDVSGSRIVRHHGIVSGEAILGANIFRDFFAGIRDIVGGRAAAYETELRKAKEIALAIEIERNYSKEQILELYFNTIYFGEGAYGVESAAKTYFGKSSRTLTNSNTSSIGGFPVGFTEARQRSTNST